MANFSELSGVKQWGAVILGGAIVTGSPVLHRVQKPG